MFCNTYILPYDKHNKYIDNVELEFDQNTIIMKNGNTLQKINIDSIKSYHFEQNKNIFRFYFGIENNIHFKNKILVFESNNVFLIDFIIKHIPFINLTSPTLPYWAILSAKYNIFYNTKLFHIIAFLIALTNITLLIYNFIFPYIKTINFVELLEKRNVIKYFDMLANIYVYTLISKITNTSKIFYDIIYNLIPNIDININLDIFSSMVTIVSNMYEHLKLFYNFVYDLIPQFHILTYIYNFIISPFTVLYNIFVNLFQNFRTIKNNIPDDISQNNNKIFSKIFQKSFDIVKFISSIILSDYYRLGYRKKYLFLGLIILLVYIIYSYSI
jgi:hypothetical protein